MSVSLAKGGNVSLSEQAPNLTEIAVGLGWDVRTSVGADYDLDASALATGPSSKVLSDQHFVFYNNLRSPEGSIEHTGAELARYDLSEDASSETAMVFGELYHRLTGRRSARVTCVSLA
ncbi:TerD family protein [Nocardia sp. NBC_01329]|uniref:TerD family protein n=1 Tax=Nocardia sp. NBC_01329 TaxID=2903594 RepID=UPI003FA346A2